MEAIVTTVVILMIVGLFAAYVFLAVFFPEWVGIAGKRAKEIESSHEEKTETSKNDEVENVEKFIDS